MEITITTCDDYVTNTGYCVVHDEDHQFMDLYENGKLVASAFTNDYSEMVYKFRTDMDSFYKEFVRIHIDES